jgi:hypothetical protein
MKRPVSIESKRKLLEALDDLMWEAIQEMTPEELDEEFKMLGLNPEEVDDWAAKLENDIQDILEEMMVDDGDG